MFSTVYGTTFKFRCSNLASPQRSVGCPIITRSNHSNNPWRRLWKSWAPAKCKFFLWLATRNTCWTSDILAKRGLSHPDKCPLCDQEDETIQHLLTSCVVARHSPRQHEHSFIDWWRKTIRIVSNEHKRSEFSDHVGCLGYLEAYECLCVWGCLSFS